jgi:hypothetical protein
MQDGIKYFLIFCEGIDKEGNIDIFEIKYSGLKINWGMLEKSIGENFLFATLKFNGYIEISEQEYFKRKSE